MSLPEPSVIHPLPNQESRGRGNEGKRGERRGEEEEPRKKNGRKRGNVRRIKNHERMERRGKNKKNGRKRGKKRN